MQATELFARIDDLYPEYAEFWKAVCMMETPTGDKERVDALGQFLKDRAAALGFRIEEHREDVSGNALCFTMNADAAGAPVCFSAHMDTVHPVGSFGETPVHTDETHIYGPGVADCKGGIAAAFLAMRALKDVGFAYRPVKLIVQSDEEISSATSGKRTVEFMKAMARGCAAFLNLEMHSTTHASLDGTPGPTAVIVRKGIMRYEFHVHGRSAHSARCWTGVSAVAEAAHKVLALEEMKSKDGLTCNCSMLRGGTAVNVVPDECAFSADIRFRDLEQMEQAKAAVEKIASTPFVSGSSCEAELVSMRCAMERDPRNEELLDRMNTIWRRVGLPVMKAGMSNGGSDAADMSSAGIPAVDSIGVTGESIHSPNERAVLASLAECAKRIAVIAMEI